MPLGPFRKAAAVPNDRGTAERRDESCQSQAFTTGRTSNTSLNRSDDAIYVGESPDGQSFSIYRSEDDAEGNPLLTIKGTDQEGNQYEQQVNPLTVDLQNASYVEVMAVNAYLVDQGKLDANDLCAFERPTEDNLEKADYMKSLRQWRDTQYDVGNMVGYHKAANVCNALVNFRHEQDGTVKYIEGTAGMTKVTQVEGRLRSGIIGMSSFGAGDGFFLITAGYAADSTTENPIMEVQTTKEDGTPDTFRININDIDPKNATQLEMFALCSHADAQGISAAKRNGDSYMSLIEYARYGGYEADNINDFVVKKQDWNKIVCEAAAAEPDNRSNIAEKWTQLLQDLLETFAEKLEEKASPSATIITKPDGSRVLQIVMKIGGAESTMSIEISKPTDAKMLENAVNETETEIEIETTAVETN